MKVCVCLVCLKAVENGLVKKGTCDLPIFTKFLKFAENYLQVSSVATKRLLQAIGKGKDGIFCENCELTVINPICRRYSQLLSAQLRLSAELERLQVLLEDSIESSSNKAKSKSPNSLLVIHEYLRYLKPFRSSLTEKCQLRRNEFLPRIIIQRLIVTPTTPGLTPKKEVEVADDFEAKTSENFYLDDGDPLEPLDFDDLFHSSGSDSFENPSEKDGRTVSTGLESSIKTEARRDLEVDIKQEQLEDPTLQPDSTNPKPTRKRKQLKKGSRLKCSTCHKLLQNDERLKIHNRNYHQPTTCKSCGQTFGGANLLNKHWARVHSTKGKIPCPSCSKLFPSRLRLSRHQKYAHDSNSESFPCPTCSKIFPTAFSLSRHNWATHGDKRYACPHCHQSFKGKSSLVYHIASAHKLSDKTFACRHCQMVFLHRTSLRYHLLSKHPNPNAVKPTVKTRKYKPTPKLEEGGEAFPCPTCGKLFSTQGIVSTHIRQVHSEEKFSCTECPAVFKVRCILKRHMETVHSSETHICHLCGNTYTSDRYLKRHVEHYHPTPAQLENWVKCPKCDKAFCKKHLMNQHLVNCRG